MRWADWLRGYVAHADPATAASNRVAMVIAGNGPFYPVYVLALIGWENAGVWLTMLASPFFMLVPTIARRHPALGRASVPLIGIANTVWCTMLLGSGSAVDLFLLPCIALTALQFRDEERWIMLSVLGLAVGALIFLIEFPLIGLMDLDAGQNAALLRLNTISVTTLTAFLAFTLAGLLRKSDAIG
jgi:hypothetical protein